MENQQPMEANFSTLILSIGSAAAMSLGLAPDPATGKQGVDKKMAKFNIDLLEMLKDKTANNLSSEEETFMSQMVNDLKMKFIALKE